MPRSRTRWGSVVAVMVLAPWMAEMSWGGYPISDLPLILLFLAPMYGGAALLIREVVRRTGRGWPSILMLAAAFGVFQAGVVDQSLFNPSYDRYDFQHPVHIDVLDISLYYFLAFVGGHVVVSIAAPIALAETWSRRGGELWLTRRGLWIVGVAYVLATLVNHFGVKDEVGHGFQAAPLQVLAALATVVVLIGAGLRWSRLSETAGRVPRPWMLAVVGFAGYLLYLPREDAVGVAIGVIVIVTVTVAVGGWSRSRHWTSDHTLALAIGSILVGLVTPFWTAPYDNTVSAGAERTADIVAATICLTMVMLTLWRRRLIAAARITSGL